MVTFLWLLHIMAAAIYILYQEIMRDLPVSMSPSKKFATSGLWAGVTTCVGIHEQCTVTKSWYLAEKPVFLPKYSRGSINTGHPNKWKQTLLLFFKAGNSLDLR
jgi:hypothetical protein